MNLSCRIITCIKKITGNVGAIHRKLIKTRLYCSNKYIFKILEKRNKKEIMNSVQQNKLLQENSTINI